MLDRLSDILRRKGMPLLTNDAIHPHLKGVAVDSGKEKAHMTAPGLLWVILFLAVVLPVRALSNDQTEPNTENWRSSLRAQADGQIEPNAGKWRTWVISSGKDYRVPPPPGRSETRAELRLLADLISATTSPDPTADHILGRRRPGISLDRYDQRTSACRDPDDSQSAPSVYLRGSRNV